MSYSQAWLESDNNNPTIIAILGVYTGGSESVVRLSSRGYSYNGIEFPATINGNIGLTESIDVESGGSSISFDDLELINNDGYYDSWLNSSTYVWKNRPIKIYLCDKSWTATSVDDLISKSKLVFNGVIDDIDSKERNTINFKVRTKLEFLNGPITETKLGAYGTWAGGQTNQDSILPIVFGEVCNMEPLAIDPSQLEYKFHRGTYSENGVSGLSDSAYELVEVRDNGVPIYNDTLTSGATVNLANGTFKLNQRPAGTITCSVLGTTKSVNLSTGAFDTTYRNNIANIIATIVTQYGKPETRLTAADLDLPNLAAFAASMEGLATDMRRVGYLVSDTANIMDVCSALASSVGAQIVFSSAGKLQLIRAGNGTVATDVTQITDSDILLNSLSISRRYDVVSSTKIGYCKNHTIQTGLLTGIPEAHKDLFSKEYLTVTAKDAGTIKSTYKLTSDPDQINTCLIVTTEAQAEANRRNTMFNTIRTVYKFTGTKKLLGLVLGQSVTITHNRFNLNATNAQVISLSPNWVDMTTEVEVLV